MPAENTLPKFPLITTLAQKPTLTGDEIIQISASEYTSLKKLVELALKNTHVFEDSRIEPGVVYNAEFDESDTLKTTLEKIISRLGGNQLATLYPAFYDTAYGVVGTFLLGGSRRTFAWYIEDDDYIYFKVTYDDTEASTPEQILGDFIDGNFTIEENFEIVRDTLENSYIYPTTNTVAIYPGSIQNLDSGSNINGIILRYFTDRAKSQYQAILYVKSNIPITKQMFSVEAPQGYGVELLFSENFDELDAAASNTVKRIITMQVVRLVDGGSQNSISIAINKALYESVIQ